MNDPTKLNDLFENRINFPDPHAKERLSRLVGLDDQISRLSKIIGLLVNPTGLKRWANQFHPGADQLISVTLRRPPLVILAGDVGSGKSELSETIGDAVARQEDIDIMLLPISLSTRGQGRVGEMTQLISSAFEYAVNEAQKLKSGNGKSRGGIILLIDEADALAQSREASQMHHEDRAGVNAFIRGIDRIANNQLPVAIIMCTNRVTALDPAIKRRAADILAFSRPNSIQRHAVLSDSLNKLNFNNEQIKAIVDATGEKKGRDFGFTFSDLTQRLIPSIVLDAYPKSPVTATRAIEIATSMEPTHPFRENQS